MMIRFKHIFLVMVGLLLLVGIASAATISIGNHTFSIHDDEKAFATRTSTVDVILDSAPDGLSGYDVTITLGDISTATIDSISFPTWATLNNENWTSSTTVTITAVDLTESVQDGATNIILATLTIEWLDDGTCTLTPSANQIDDDDGDAIIPSYDAGTITVQFIGNSFVERWVPHLEFSYDTGYDYNIDNGTYTQYWLSELMETGDFPFYGFVYSLMAPIMNIFGYAIFLIIWLTYLFIVWIRSGEITMPLVIGVLTAGLWGTMFPPEAKYMAYVLLAICIGVIFVRVIYDKY